MELGALLHCSRSVPPQPRGARLKEDALQRLLSVGRPPSLQQQHTQPPPPPPQPSSPPSSPGCATPSTPTLSPLTTCASLTDLPLLSDLIDCHPPSLPLPTPSAAAPAGGSGAGKGAHVSALLSQRQRRPQRQPPGCAPPTPSRRAPPDELFHRLHVAAVPSTRARDRATARAAEAHAEPAAQRVRRRRRQPPPPKARVLLVDDEDDGGDDGVEEDPRRRGTAFERLHRDSVAWGTRGAELERTARRRRASRESGEASMLEVSAANRHRPRLSSGSRRRTRSVPAGRAFERLSTHGAARSRRRCEQREAEAADAAARAVNPWEEVERQWRGPLADPPSHGAAVSGAGRWGRKEGKEGGEEEVEEEEVDEEDEEDEEEEPFRPNVQALHPGMVMRVAPASREASAKYVSERLFNDSAHRKERRESERHAADTLRKKKIARAHERAMNRTAG